MEQMTSSKLVKEYGKAVFCHFVYLTSMQSTSCKTSMWVKKQQLEQDMEQQTGSKQGKEYDKAISLGLFNFYTEYIM